MTELGNKLVKLFDTVEKDGVLNLLNDADINQNETFWDIANSLHGANLKRFTNIANMFAEGRSIKEIKNINKLYSVNIKNKELDVFFDALIKHFSNPFGKIQGPIGRFLLKITEVSPKSLEAKFN